MQGFEARAAGASFRFRKAVMQIEPELKKVLKRLRLSGISSGRKLPPGSVGQPHSYFARLTGRIDLL